MSPTWKVRTLRASAGAGLLATLAALAALAGCASSTPDYDARFGQAVRQLRQAQVIDPQAGENTDTVRGLDGNAAREAMQRYRNSFREPPPVVNVINIGGSAGAASR